MYCESSILFMQKQNTESHVYLFLKKIICIFCDMSRSESPPAIRKNMGTVRTMIQLAHVCLCYQDPAKVGEIHMQRSPRELP